MSEKDDLIANLKERMQKSIGSYETELSTLRAGKPNPGILSKIKVESYGGSMYLNQLANIFSPDPHTLGIEPWDKNLLKTIEKTLEKANLGIMPINDGKIIKLPFPPLTEDRRKDLIKMIQRFAEDTKVAIRNIRRDIVDKIKKLEKDKKISEDEMFRSEEDIQKVTDNFIAKVDEALKKKEREIKEI
jgi:ribosome recycling factor